MSPSPLLLVARPTAVLVLGAALSSPSSAQERKSQAEVEAEIAFARGLAAEWSFVDLAGEVIRDVEEGRIEDRQAENLALVKCEVFSIGARNERDPMRRNELFEEAIASYEAYIDEHPYASNRSEAEIALVESAALYARSIDIALEDLAGEEAEALNDRKIDVLTEAVRRTGDLIEALEAEEEPTQAQKAQLFNLNLVRGQMYAAISAAQPDDEFFKQQAINTLENLIFDVGEGTPFALRAYAALGDVYAGHEDWFEAAAYYEGIIEQVCPTDPDLRQELIGWNDLSPPDKARRFLFVELATPGTLRAYRNVGDLESARKYALFFYNLWRDEGFDLSSLGWESLLEVAETVLESDGYVGGDLTDGEADWYPTEEAMREEVRQRRLQRTSVDFSLELANQVADENKGNSMGSRAGDLIDRISERPGVRISPEQMYLAAYGAYREERFQDALQGYRRLLARLETMEQADRFEYGAKVMNGVGNALRRQDRDLEAAMAFREGIVTWRDPEYDELNARSYYAMIKRVASAASTGTDKQVVEELVTEAENLAASVSTSRTDEILWNQGKKAERRKEWPEAIAKYEKIVEDPDYEYWELAFVQIGYCYLRDGRARDALERFEEYLEMEKRETESPVLLTRRKQATATARFYRGYILSLLADRKYDASEEVEDGELDPSGYPAVIEAFEGFHEDYPEQQNLAVISLKKIVEAKAKTGDVTGAREALDEMIETFPEEDHTGDAAVTFYRALLAQQERARAAGDEEAVQRLTRDMAATLQVSNRIDATPSYVNLRKEGSLWEEAGEYENARVALEAVVSRFQDHPEHGEKVERYVIPQLAGVLLELRQVNDAKTLLAPLVMPEDARPTKDLVILFARATCGWVEGSGFGVEEVPGAGGDETEFEFITQKLFAIVESPNLVKWNSCEWYEAKFNQVFAYYAWGKIDARRAEKARDMMDTVVTFLDDDDFNDVDQDCSSDDADPAFRERFGEGVLQSRYQWLHRATR